MTNKEGNKRPLHESASHRRNPFLPTLPFTTPPGPGERTKETALPLPELRSHWPEVYDALWGLSFLHYLYLRRNGYGLTRDFRKAAGKTGTAAVVETRREGLTELQYEVLRHAIDQGSVFASYATLIPYLRRQGFLPQQGPLDYWAELEPERRDVP